MRRPTPPELTERVLATHAARPDLSARDISRRVALDHTTVSRLLASQAPVVEALRTYRRDEILAGWQWVYLSALDELQHMDDETPAPRNWSEHNQRSGVIRNYAVALGIATDKLQLVTGQPTAIVAQVHEIRVDLADLAARLHAARQHLTSLGSSTTTAGRDPSPRVGTDPRRALVEPSAAVEPTVSAPQQVVVDLLPLEGGAGPCDATTR